VAGAALLALGLGVAAEASTFEVAFLTDPVGPKALPLVGASILVATGFVLLLKTPEPRAWPPRSVFGRLAGATAVFLLYAFTLEPVGFTLATTAATATLSMLFGGPWRRSVAAAFVLSVTLWYLFVWVLDLPLPLGLLWTR
jgi:putative tricarboxylic transport membrane protein